MSRIAAEVNCTADDKKELERLSKSRTDEARLVERAKIVLGCLAGRRNDEIAAGLGYSGGDGGNLAQAVRGGRVGRIERPRPPRQAAGLPGSGIAAANSQATRSAAPGGAGESWDGGTLAKALEVSDDAVWRILRKEGIQLRRLRSWCVSTDPEFAAKAADVIGLYLSRCAKRAGAERGREAIDSGAGKKNQRCLHQQRKDRAGTEKHLQTTWHYQPVRSA